MLKVSLEESTYIIRDKRTMETLALVTYGEYPTRCGHVHPILLEHCKGLYKQLSQSPQHNEVLDIISALENREVHDVIACVEVEVGAKKAPFIHYTLANRRQNSRVEVRLGVTEEFLSRYVPAMQGCLQVALP